MTNFESLVEIAPIAIAIVNRDGHYLYANRKWLDLIENNTIDVYNHKPWMHSFINASTTDIGAAWHEYLSDLADFSIECSIKVSEGEKEFFNFTAFRIPYGEHEIRHAVFGVSVASKKRVEHKLRMFAIYDPLTGIANRTTFIAKLESAFEHANRHDSYIVVFFIDLDRFKLVNDTLGHSAGDELLKGFTNRITHVIRKTDTLARLGGDEFALLLEDISSPESISVTANKIYEALNNPFTVNGKEIYVTASIGIAVSSKDTKDYDSLIKEADIAMYLAKEKGRNNFQYYTKKLNKIIHRKLDLNNKLVNAIKNRELSLSYQPQVIMPNAELYGAEVLLRWKNKYLGNISPSEFIPISEESGEIIKITKWIFAEAFRHWVLWQNKYDKMKNLNLSLNISGKHIIDGGVIPMLKSMIREYDVNPEFLTIEITENVFIQNSDYIKKAFFEIRDLGLKIALDDFGTGYSSLSYLSKFPINTLKIDYSFVHNMLHNPHHFSIVKAIIAIANSLDLTLIAEGVENDKLSKILLQQGCKVCQGFFYSKPLTTDNFRIYLEKSSK